MKLNILILSLILAISSFGNEDEAPVIQEPENFNWIEDSSGSSSWSDQEKVAFDRDKLWQTNGVVIIHRDKIVYERYENGFDKEKVHRIWSVSKSFSSALWGIRFGQLNLSEGVFAHKLTS
ncbi:MAG: hypothetical protein NXH75_10990, partial [Halobacteriovoraceae bacterium]|nr:hypothetical protein [Halobacteriovoraceae bacterium]